MQPETQPDAAWVAALSGATRASADDALRKAVGERRLFSHIAREHRAAGRSSYVEIDAPLELYAIARLTRPRHVVEVGVSSGVSSAYLLAALDRNGSGTLHSVDRPKREAPRRDGAGRTTASWSLPPGRSSGWAVPDRLRPRWDLRIGDKKVVLPLLAEELDRIDLFVYDVPHDDQAALGEFRAIDARFAGDGVGIADHGPGGGMCPSLARWARGRASRPRQCQALGLYGFRSASDGARGPTV